MKSKNYFLAIIIITFLKVSTTVLAQDIVPRGILDKVFLFQYGSSSGTCFYMSVKKDVYLVTARHIFPKSLGPNSDVEIDVFHQSGPQKLKGKLLVHSDSTIDIAVIDVNIKSDKDSTNYYRISSDNVHLSQECFFLGYPHGLRTNDIVEKPINNGFPIPFVKKAIVSGLLESNRLDKAKRRFHLVLDGINNQGFSGGPVIVFNKESNPDRKISVVAVINGYLSEGKEYSVQQTKFTVQSNSGLIITTPIEYAYELIEARRQLKN